MIEFLILLKKQQNGRILNLGLEFMKFVMEKENIVAKIKTGTIHLPTLTDMP